MNRFGASWIAFIGTLIVGRNHYLQTGEQQRLEWRRQRVIVDSRKIICITYDELLERLSHRLTVYESVSAESGSKT